MLLEPTSWTAGPAPPPDDLLPNRRQPRGDAARRCPRARAAALWAFVLAAFVLALRPLPAEAQRLIFRQYAQDQGLANLGVLCLSQNASGFVLVCTENGAARYDGRRFELFGHEQGLPDQGIVYDIKVASNGRLFVVFSNAIYVSGTDGRGELFERGQYTALRSADGPIEVDAAHSAALLGNDLLLVERGRLRIARMPADTQAAAGVVPMPAPPAGATPAPPAIPSLEPYFSDAVLAEHPDLKRIVSVSVTADGIWLGCGDGRICHVPLAGLQPAGAIEIAGEADGLPNRDWTAFLLDRHGTIWARSTDQIAHRDAGHAGFVLDPIPGGPGRYAGHPDRLVMAEDHAGNILTQGRTGLLIRSGTVWRSLNMAQGVPEGAIVAIMFDREGSLWLAVRDQGAFRGVGVGQWENWTRADGLSDDVIWQMARTGDGPLWVATEGGADGLVRSALPSPRSLHLPGPGFAIATTSSGKVWHTTMDGVTSRYDPATGLTTPVATLPATDEMMLERATGTQPDRLWLGSHDGLYLADDADAARPTTPVRVPGVEGRVRDICSTMDGNLWVVTQHQLLHRQPDGTIRTVMTTATGLVLNPRAMAFAPDGTLWVGSGMDGVQRLRLDGDRVLSSDRLAMPVIGSNNVLLLRRDLRGWMWVGGDRGLDVWTGQSWHHLDEEDGLLSNDLDEGSVFEDVDGSLWFGTGHGISHLLDPHPLLRASPLHPVITSVLLGGRSLPPGVIAWSREPLLVTFSALDYRDETTVRFRYRLRGVDRDWVETSEREVHYPQLPPGHLVFQVMAYDPLKRRTSSPVAFDIVVRAPWWQTWPFMLACVLGVVALIASFWQLRIRYLLARQRQLEELVAIRTSEIERARASLFQQATYDSLTGLLNRPASMQAFDQAIEESRRSTRALAIALVDLDHFKSINDRFGHLGGDLVLRELTRRLREALLPEENAGRYGGEELVLILPNDATSGPQRVRALQERMVGRTFEIDGSDVAVTCSIGVAWHHPGDTAESLLRRADRCLYVAKNSGRDRIAVEQDLDGSPAP